jgi:hypothetical protein
MIVWLIVGALVAIGLVPDAAVLVDGTRTILPDSISISSKNVPVRANLMYKLGKCLGVIRSDQSFS